MRSTTLRLSLAAILLGACSDGVISGGVDGGGAVDAGARAPDAGEVDAGTAGGVAPEGAVPGEEPAADGDNPADAPAGGEAIYRVESRPDEHVAFRLDFDPGVDGVVMEVDRWDGRAAVWIGETDAGPGLRVLAARDPDEVRTYWVRVRAEGALVGANLSVTRTPFQDGLACAADCAALLQLPLPNDPRVDGYAIDQAVFRYQFGRRDMIMWIRRAGREMIADGREPFRVEDISQWDGLTPGADVGNERHASHERGKDVDISLYGEDGAAPFRSYCTTANDGDGRECLDGTRMGFDGYANADLIGAFYESGRVTMCFLDAELIEAVVAEAPDAVTDGLVDEEWLPLFSDGRHLQHWPNHDNHVHVRVSEEEPTAGAPRARALPPVPGEDAFEAP